MKKLLLFFFTISLCSCQNGADDSVLNPPMQNQEPCDWITTVFPPESFDLEQVSILDFDGSVDELQVVTDEVFYALGTLNVGGYPTVLKTEDGGDSWVDLELDIKDFGRSMFFKDKNKGFITVHDVTGCPSACLHKCVLYKTEDGGLNWERKEYSDLKGILYDIQFDSQGNAYTYLFLDDTVTLMKSTDDAESWNAIYTAPDINLGATFFSFTIAEDKIYGTTDNGSIIKLDTEGNLLATLETSLSNTWELKVLDENNIIATSVGGAAISNDGGLTWSDLHDRHTRIMNFNTPTEGLLLLNKSDCPTDVYQVNDVIAYTKDGGQTWEESELSTNLLSYYSNSQQLGDGTIVFTVYDMSTEANRFFRLRKG